MRIAVVSDIHGNLTAFEAVLADLREAVQQKLVNSPDFVGAWKHARSLRPAVIAGLPSA
jgi:hypothetical protein